jgi:hypothetical protein
LVFVPASAKGQGLPHIYISIIVTVRYHNLVTVIPYAVTVSTKTTK